MVYAVQSKFDQTQRACSCDLTRPVRWVDWHRRSPLELLCASMLHQPRYLARVTALQIRMRPYDPVSLVS